MDEEKVSFVFASDDI